MASHFAAENGHLAVVRLLVLVGGEALLLKTLADGNASLFLFSKQKQKAESQPGHLAVVRHLVVVRLSLPPSLTLSLSHSLTFSLSLTLSLSLHDPALSLSSTWSRRAATRCCSRPRMTASHACTSRRTTATAPSPSTSRASRVLAACSRCRPATAQRSWSLLQPPDTRGCEALRAAASRCGADGV